MIHPVLTKEQVLRGLDSLIEDRKSFLRGDDENDADNIFVHDIAVLSAAKFFVQLREFTTVR